MENLSNQQAQPKFSQLQGFNKQQIAKMLAFCMVQMNSMWKKSGVTVQEAFQYYNHKISDFSTDLLCLWTQNEQIVAVNYSLDIIDYLTQDSMPVSKSEVFTEISKTADKLEIDYYNNMKVQNRGEYVVGISGAMKPQIAKKGYATKLMAQFLNRLKKQGWKGYVARASNRATSHMVKKFGGRVIDSIPVTHPQVEGQFFQLLRLDFDQTYNETEVLKYISK